MTSTEAPELQQEVLVTADGGVKKVVLQEGAGELPAKHARCLVHYVGRLVETGEVFMDTRGESTSQEPAQLVAGRDSLGREVGLHLAVATMRRGERCRLTVSTAYGYGKQGSFSFPTVPPGAELCYELELLDWEAPDEGREARGMTFEDRVEAAERRRLDGNALFGRGEHEAALSKYRLALSYLDEELLMQLEGPHLDTANGVRGLALLNAAACHLQAGEHAAAVAACTEVLLFEPKSAKALFRRGRARAALGQNEAAVEDLSAAREAAPGDAGIARELAAARQALREDRQAQGRLFKGFFSKEGTGGLYGDDGSGNGGNPRQQQRQAAAAVSAAAQTSWWGSLLGWLTGGLRALFPAFFSGSRHTKPHAA